LFVLPASGTATRPMALWSRRQATTQRLRTTTRHPRNAGDYEPTGRWRMKNRNLPIRRTPIRRTPVRKVRSGTRRGQPTKAEKETIHDQVYAETGGRCDIGKHPQHVSGVLPLTGSVFERWHLVHLKGKRVHGWGRDNLCGGCYWCHIEYLHNAGGKPCPPKVKP
jgi:hypothetical protein